MIVFIFAISFFTSALADKSGKISIDDQTFVSVENRQRKWISEIMMEAEMRFHVDPNVSRDCRKDFEIYKQHVRNQTVWAIRMMESSEWPRVGLLFGGTTHFGHWAECLKSEGPQFKGQYCLVEASFNFTFEEADHTPPAWVEWPRENSSAWKVIKTHEITRIRMSRQTLNWAICLPSSCTATDIEKSIENTLRPLFEASDLSVKASVNPLLCNVKETQPFPPGYHYTRLLVTFLIAVVISATVYEFNADSSTKEKDTGAEGIIFKLFKCFSAIRSCKILTRFSDNTYSILYFLKTFCAFINIIGHTLFFRAIFPNMNMEELEMKYKPWAIEPLFANIINVFVLISGFLTTFHFDFSSTEISGIKILFWSIIFRWLRMIPVLGLTILYMIFILPYSNDGPLWKTLIFSEAEYCASNWWTNVLALNNLIGQNGICFRTSWYITVDMQLSIIATVLLLICKKCKKLGAILITLTFASSLAYTFFIIYWNEYDGFRLYIGKEILKCTGFFKVYISTYYRLGPYLIGCMTALLTRNLMTRNYKFSPLQMALLIFGSSLIGFGIQCYAFLFFKVGRPYWVLENAIFGAFNGTLFVLPVAVLICIYFVSGLGIMNKILEMKIFIPIGRLGFCMYLVSFLFQKSHIASRKTVLYLMTRSDIYWFGFIDIIYSILFGFILYLISEGPINNMTQLLRTYVMSGNGKRDDILLRNGEKKLQNGHALMTNETENDRKKK